MSQSKMRKYIKISILIIIALISIPTFVRIFLKPKKAFEVGVVINQNAMVREGDNPNKAFDYGSPFLGYPIFIEKEEIFKDEAWYKNWSVTIGTNTRWIKKKDIQLLKEYPENYTMFEMFTVFNRTYFSKFIASHVYIILYGKNNILLVIPDFDTNQNICKNETLCNSFIYWQSEYFTVDKMMVAHFKKLSHKKINYIDKRTLPLPLLPVQGADGEEPLYLTCDAIKERPKKCIINGVSFKVADRLVGAIY